MPEFRVLLGLIVFLLQASPSSLPAEGDLLAQAEVTEVIEAERLNQEVVELYNRGRYAEAIPLAEKLLSVREQALGPDHPNVVQSLNNLALLYHCLGNYAKVERLYQRVLAITEQAFGPDHPNVATSLNGPALLYCSLGDYTKAERLLQRALGITEKALGPDHPNVATSLNSLAALYDNTGEYGKAEPLLQRALGITEKALGPDHPNVATSLDYLGRLYRNLGNYTKAEPVLQRALAIKEKALGPDHPGVGQSLDNLAQLYVNLGDYAKAEPLFQHALAIREKAFGPDHPNVATSLNNLAVLHKELGDYAKAEPLFQRALAISQKALGPNHPNVATGLDNLAVVYGMIGDNANAEPLFQHALAIREKAFGPGHPNVATSLNNLAVLYVTLGDNAKAEPLFQRALAISEKAFGLDHPNVVQVINNLSVLLAARGDFCQAHSLYVRGRGVDERLIDQIVGFTSEDRQMKFLASTLGPFDASISLVATYLIADASARKDALNLWLRRKGVLLEAQRRFQEALVYSDDPKAVHTFQELARVRARLSEMTFGGPGKENPEDYRKKMSELESREMELEAKLNSISQAYALRKKTERADTVKVAQSLPENTALIEFARINIYNFMAKAKEGKWLPAHYLAFVIHAGEGDKVALVDLGDAEPTDKEIGRFKELLPDIRDIRGAKAQESSRKLYEVVFAPIKKELGATKEIFISPDGNLNLIPFEVLRGPDERFLIEDYSFNYLAAGRDLLGFGGSKKKGGKALLMGDPDFDLGADEKESTLRELTVRASGEREGQSRSSDMRGLHFARLPATREEVTAIGALLGPEKSEIYLGKEALEEILMRKQTPTILHLATHGFLLKDVDLGGVSGLVTDRGRMDASAIFSKPSGEPVKIENPLLRSGIVLAGANRVISSEATDKSDGIVTAEKILGLKLRGTDMVVLSACETGLGEVKVGEGVYGLRRAFTQAGAKSLVMSMWAVPDKETKELMTNFYRKVIAGKISRCQALRQAALSQMQIVKERYGYNNPFYWGAFVFMGEP